MPKENQTPDINNLTDAVTKLKNILTYLESIQLSEKFDTKSEEIKNGGIIVFEKEGHGLVVAQSDYGKILYDEAERICSALEIDGFKDWRIPTKEELLMIYDKLHMKGKGNFRKLSYWSSTEASSYTRYFQNFDTGDISHYSHYDGLFWLRPVRSF